METVETLRKKGYKVAVYHTRRYDHKLIQPMLAKGGRTEVVITTPKGDTVEGQARCSKCDAYDKKVGVRIALQRALDKLANPKKVEAPKKEVDKNEVYVTVNLLGFNIPITKTEALDLRDQLDAALLPETIDEFKELFKSAGLDNSSLFGAFDQLLGFGLPKSPR
jgi:hypothetical protein